MDRLNKIIPLVLLYLGFAMVAYALVVLVLSLAA